MEEAAQRLSDKLSTDYSASKDAVEQFLRGSLAAKYNVLVYYCSLPSSPSLNSLLILLLPLFILLSTSSSPFLFILSLPLSLSS